MGSTVRGRAELKEVEISKLWARKRWRCVGRKLQSVRVGKLTHPSVSPRRTVARLSTELSA